MIFFKCWSSISYIYCWSIHMYVHHEIHTINLYAIVVVTKVNLKTTNGNDIRGV